MRLMPAQARASRRRARRARPQLAYSPGLDGLRGLAVAAVVLYHAGVSWAGGGFLGVELFFVLSGFLITSLLLAEWWQTGGIVLRDFWARRARRLLPALFALLAVVGCYYALAGEQAAIPGLRGDGIATLLYYANWHQIAIGSSYFAATGPPSPLTHTWSLAIEEQFYAIWPLLVLGLTWLLARRDRRQRGAEGALSTPPAAVRPPADRRRALRGLLGVSALGAIASALDMAIAYDGGRGLDRVYYGTDTRAFGLLIGASLAIAMALRHWRAGAGAGEGQQVRRRVRAALAVAATLGAVAVLAELWLARGPSSWLYPYGFLGLDLAAAAVIAAAVVMPRAPSSRLLSLRAPRELGKVSYGLYLWHYPLFLWLDESSTGLTGWRLLALRLSVAMAVTLLSYHLIEQPIRRRRVPGWLVRSLAPVAASGALVSVLIGSALSSISFSDAAAQALPQPAAHLRGTDPPCRVKVRDTPTVGISPLPERSATRSEYRALGSHSLTWSGQSTLTFRTCPPERVLVVGDSLAYTLGVGLMENEQRYGVEVDDAAVLGCAFTNSGRLQVSGRWLTQSDGCPSALSSWGTEARRFGDRVVVVELGYRDQFNWLLAGRLRHLGEPAFDSYLERRIERYVAVLGDGGRRPVVFLSVPWSKPPANPDGSASPAASPARHREINALLLQAARAHHNVHVLDLDRLVSPSGHYQPTVNGKLCRFDGIHFTLYCSELLQPYLLTEVRRLGGS